MSMIQTSPNHPRSLPSSGRVSNTRPKRQQHCRASHQPQRSGLTLLEVLVSIFVLSVGLLGVATLIPMGSFALVESSKADRSAACGRAGQREIKIRRMLDPYMWLDPTGTPYVDPVTDVLPMRSYAIDPLFVSLNSLAGNPRFPFNGSLSMTMARATLRAWPSAAVAMTPAVARRVFTWEDDLEFEINDDPDLRPLQLFAHSSGTSTMLANATTREAQRNYSWMVTVTPAATEAGLFANNKRLYTVSVVVFYKRNLTYNPTAEAADLSERTVGCTFQGTGYGGGDVLLSCPAALGSEQLDVKRKEWILLSGPNPAAFGGTFKWYRVVAVDEEPELIGATWQRYVTLAGPDWHTGVNPTAEAALLRGVIGVYSTTVELDR